MRVLRIAIRLTLIGLHILIGILLCIFVLPSDWINMGTLRHRNIVRWWLRRCTRIIGIRLTVHGQPTTGTILIIANHISWMDIAIIGGLLPVSFLSKAEIVRWLVIGYLARKGGTLFIERGAGAEVAAQLMGKHLQAGGNIAFFPEGSTGDGATIRHLHPRLFMAAIDNRIAVQPLVISYPYRGAVNNVHPKALYSSDKLFFRQALSIFGEPHIDAVVRYTDSLSGHRDRKQLSEEARELMSAAYDSSRALQ